MTMVAPSVAELSVDELRTLIHEVVTEVINELLADPDEGLELREELEQRLQRSREKQQAGLQQTVPVEEVARKLGLEW
jgi:hypothetical protein